MLKGIDLADLDQARRDKFSRSLVILIVLSTVTGAVSSVLLASANEKENEMAVLAQRLTSDAMAELANDERAAELVVSALLKRNRQQVRWAKAFHTRFFGATTPERRAAVQEQERWLKLFITSDLLAENFAKRAGLPRVGRRSEFGPERDLTFPDRLFAAARSDAIRIEARRDAANIESTAWGDRHARFTFVLTLLAVSAYLFGLALSIDQGARYGFAALGGAILMVAWLLTLVAILTPVVGPPERAVAAFAKGRAELAGAGVDPDASRAVEAFSEALTAYDGYERAHFYRARARWIEGSRYPGDLLTDPGAIDDVVSDLEAAYSGGSGSPGVTYELGRTLLIRGSISGSRTDWKRAFTLLSDLTDRGTSNPRIWLAAAAAAAATEKRAEGEALLDQGMRLTYLLENEDKKQTIRVDNVTRQLAVAHALTLLDAIQHSPSGNSHALDLKNRILRWTSGDGELLTDTEVPELKDVRVDVYPAGVEASWTPLVRAGESPTIWIQWYFRPHEANLWAVVPELGSTEHAGRSPVDGRSYLLFSESDCLSSGEYKAEIYVDGRLAQTRTKTFASDLTRAGVARFANVAFCYPSSWQPLGHGYPGLLEGFESPDKRYAALLFRLEPVLPDQDRFDRNFDSASFLVGSDGKFFFGSRPRPLPKAPSKISFFMGLDQLRQKVYELDDGLLIIRSGVGKDGGHVAMALRGPSSWFASDEWSELFGSATLYQFKLGAR